MIRHLAIAPMAFGTVPTVAAQETNAVAPDKSGCNLFDPVPENLGRGLSPDRPDKTESAYAVDAGHYQVEADFANFTYDDAGGSRMKAWQAGDFDLKAGLLNKVDLQLVYDSYLNVNTTDRLSHSTTQSGFGDLTTRFKVNLWGSDGGQTTFALSHVSDQHGQSGRHRRSRRRYFSFAGIPWRF